ncbi:hypothetical protein CPB84DRAFT_1852381 [Gymnopilus junonius]|uniref:Uncharacterized protein n=1 Tax=Gymnopilus junonius TaxID=109634 RepID=A0A9P5TGL1_GYMJU|nr:hypothetical protein CPB84DRAFT_1852381 [Gymnopilus junonius]
MRAGTVIHEAAHAINKDVDHFKKDGSPYDFGAKPDTKNFLVGYKDSHMNDLKALRSDQMHKNADSYSVCGEECAKLARRALEEEDLELSSCVALTKHVPITLRIRPPLKFKPTKKSIKKAAKALRKAAKKAKAQSATAKKAGSKSARAKRN